MAQLNFYDTHCHLDLPPLCEHLPVIMARARTAGVTRFVVPGVAPDGWRRIAEMAEDEPSLVAAFGLHPWNAHQFRPELLTTLSCYLPQTAAIGEIGLDYQMPEPSRALQREAFRGQVRLAVAGGKPVLIHCRKAFQDLLQILREERVDRVGGVMHAFSGSPEMAAICIRLGLFIGIAGAVTFPNAVRPVEVVHQVPLEYLVLETDAPDLAPEPYRGMVNEPAYLLATAQRVAAVKGVALETVAAVTSRNAAILFDRRRLTTGGDQ